MEDINKILFPHFASTPYEKLFVGNFVDLVNTFNLNDWKPTMWNPKHIQTPTEEFSIYCTLGWLIEKVEEIIPTATHTNQYYLTLYLDKHLPMIIHMEEVNKYNNSYLLTDYGDGAPIKFLEKEVFHEGMLPDVLNYIPNCSFFSDNRQKTNPVVHLLSKALPQRCTIRNLREIISDYCRKYDDIYNFIIACMKCSLLGLYKTSTNRPSYRTRIKIMQQLDTNKAIMLQWMMKDHQQLLFYIIKEFLVFGVRQIPSIFEEINQRYYWENFESCVLKAMNMVRKFENETKNILDFPNVEYKLISINKQQVHHLYRPKRHSFATTVLTEIEKFDDIKCVDYIKKCIPTDYIDIMYQMAIRVPLNIKIPFDWLKCFNVSSNTIENISNIQEIYNQEGSKSNLKNFIHSLNRYELEAIRDLCTVFQRKRNVRIFLLPAHIYKQQYLAMKKKYEIKGPLGDIGKTYICLHCKQFKGFCNHINKGKRVNLYAYGHSKILVEDDNLKLYCGKRCDKVDAKKRHSNLQQYSSFIQMDDEEKQKLAIERNKKRNSKEKRKDLKNQICANTELVSVNLIGVLMQFYDNMYTICPVCANFMIFDSKYFTENGFYCGCCIEHGKLYSNICCEWCKVPRGNETWTPILVKENEEKKNIYLCSNCHKPWIRNSDGILELETIKRGLINKWKRLQHPSN